MKVWVMTKIWDDGDPGDHASLEKVRVFSTLEGVRDAFAKLGEMHVHGADEGDFPDAEDWDEINRRCRATPELYCWCSRDTTTDFGWDGGTLVEFSEIEVDVRTYTAIFKAKTLNLRIFVTQFDSDYPDVGRTGSGLAVAPELEGRLKRKVAELCCHYAEEKKSLIRSLELVAVIDSTQAWDVGAHLAVAHEVSGGWEETP